MPSIFEGILFGGLVILLIGPVFFALIQTSIEQGFGSATFFALGVWVSDVTMLILSGYGLSQLAEQDVYALWLGLAGGAVLVAFGLYSILKAGPSPIADESIKIGNPGRNFLKGLALNGFNPMVMLFWSGVVGYELTNYNHDLNDRILFFLGILVTMACGDLTKAFFASRLRTALNPTLVTRLNRGVGLLLVLFGGRLLYLSLTNSF